VGAALRQGDGGSRDRHPQARWRRWAAAHSLQPSTSQTDNEGGLQLTVFRDADMAGDIDGRRSTSGVLVFLRSAPIAWQSLKQKIVTLSTC
jgi:hypothetical protein